jgi:anthranilate phosphoribosyltransferase
LLSEPSSHAPHGLGSRTASFARDIVSGKASTKEIVDMLTSFQAEGFSGQDVLDLALAFKQATVPAETRFSAVADLCGTGGGTPPPPPS